MSYTLIRTINSAFGKVAQIGDNIYFALGDVVYEYDMVTDDLTDISGSTFASPEGLGLTYNPQVLNGGLFVMSENYTSKLAKVWKWTGGTSWTTVLTYDFSIWSDGGIHWSNYFSGGPDHLIYHGNDGVTGASFADHVVKHSSNGISWSNGSVSWSSTPSFTPDSEVAVGSIKFQANLVKQPLAFGGASLSGSPFTQAVVTLQWNGVSAWVEVLYGEADFPYVTWTPDNCSFLWSSASAWPNDNWVDLMFMRSNLDYVDADVPDCGGGSWSGDEEAVYSVGFENTGLKAFGRINKIGNPNPGTNWWAVSTDSSYVWETPGEYIASAERPRWAIRRTDGKVVIITTSAGGGVNEIYLGTQVYDELAPSVAKFYQGIDGLTYRSDLPFGSVLPHGMAVRPDGQVAVGNAGQVFQAGSDDTYASWEDTTHDLAAAAVNALRWVRNA